MAIERSFAFSQSERNLAWYNSHSISSEGRNNMMPPSPLPMDSLWMSSAAAATQLQPGQISPLSAGLDNSSAPTMVHSASSSCADSWSTDYVDRDDVEMDNNWEQGSDDILTIPKLEPVEDDLNMDDLKAAPLAPASIDSAKIDPKPKRPRGRPRKHPLTTAVSASKVTKGRSKTGCITCRKRKKKCDEAVSDFMLKALDLSRNKGGISCQLVFSPPCLVLCIS
jgi:hypothetical protein